MNLEIKIKKIFKYYGEKAILKDIDFSINSKEFFVLLGQNGSGKTTLIRILLNLIKPSSGEIKIEGNGKNIPGNKIGFLLEDEMPFDYFTPYEYLKFFRNIYKSKKNVDEVLKEFNLYEEKKTKIFKLSKGMKKKLCIAKAFLTEPLIWILDEPFDGVDIIMVEEIYKILKKEREEGKIVIIATHHFEFVKNYASHIGILDRGNFLGKYEVEKIGDSILDFYLEKIK